MMIIVRCVIFSIFTRHRMPNIQAKVFASTHFILEHFVHITNRLEWEMVARFLHCAHRLVEGVLNFARYYAVHTQSITGQYFTTIWVRSEKAFSSIPNASFWKQF